MTKVTDNVFENQEIPLDDNDYERNRFVRCEFVYAGGPFRLAKDNEIVQCTWRLDGCAGETLNLFVTLYHLNDSTRRQVEMMFDEIRRGESLR